MYFCRPGQSEVAHYVPTFHSPFLYSCLPLIKHFISAFPGYLAFPSALRVRFGILARGRQYFFFPSFVFVSLSYFLFTLHFLLVYALSINSGLATTASRFTIN